MTTEIDYRVRAQYLVQRLDALAAQAAWERTHQVSVVRWDVALERLLQHPDGELQRTGEREDILREMTKLLLDAQAALSLERRNQRLLVKRNITEFLTRVHAS
jgi:hypothetical protein